MIFCAKVEVQVYVSLELYILIIVLSNC